MMQQENDDIETSGHSAGPSPVGIRTGQTSSGYARLLPESEVPPTSSKLMYYGSRIVALLVVILAIAVPISVMKNQIDTLNAQYTQLNSDYQALSLRYNDISGSVDTLKENDRLSQNQTVVLVDKRLKNSDIQIANLTKQVAEIANHSNAQVLQELAQTKSSMSNELQQTQKHIEQELNATITRMNVVVSSATMTIFAVQDNVTAELTTMSQNMQHNIDDLNADVKLAEQNINDQVDKIQSQINTYQVVADKQFAAENDFVRFQLAGTFTLIGCLISLWHINSHGRHYTNPGVQRRVMAVLWMVPIYSVTSWLSLVFPGAENVFGTIRDIYESYVVYTFIGLLIAVLEEGKGTGFLIQRLRQHIIDERIADEEAIAANAKRPTLHLTPTCARMDCLYDTHKPASVAEYWLYQCRWFVMQFVFLKPIFAVLPSFLALVGYDYDGTLMYTNHHINWASAKIYVIFLENVSVALAFYGLLKFYHGTETDLAWCEPWPKFLCIKGVVFMTFWQGFFITLMSSFGYVDEKSASQIQNLLICIEMLLASLAHYYIFPYYEWEPGYQERKEKQVQVRLADTLAMGDFYRDAKQLFVRKKKVMDTPDSSHGGLLIEGEAGGGATSLEDRMTEGTSENDEDDDDDEHDHDDNGDGNDNEDDDVEMGRRHSSRVIAAAGSGVGTGTGTGSIHSTPTSSSRKSLHSGNIEMTGFGHNAGASAAHYGSVRDVQDAATAAEGPGTGSSKSSSGTNSPALQHSESGAFSVRIKSQQSNNNSRGGGTLTPSSSSASSSASSTPTNTSSTIPTLPKPPSSSGPLQRLHTNNTPPVGIPGHPDSPAMIQFDDTQPASSSTNTSNSNSTNSSSNTINSHGEESGVMVTAPGADATCDDYCVVREEQPSVPLSVHSVSSISNMSMPSSSAPATPPRTDGSSTVMVPSGPTSPADVDVSHTTV